MRTLLSLAAVLATPALAVADTSPTGFPTSRGPHSCGTRQVPALTSSTARVALAPGTQRVVYLNHNGGTYTVSSARTNAATNTANTIVSGNGQGRTATIAPMSSSFDWPMIAACVKDFYKDINVRFVETEPTSGTFIEAVVGGNGSELGFPASSGILGIASADDFCGVTEAGIAFSFSEAHVGIPSRNEELCTTVAHEIGHLLALEHETMETDLMSYVPVSEAPSKAFEDAFSACGTYPGQPTQCTCNASQQNSFQRLTTYVGPRPTETVKPTLSIESPDNGDTVGPTFELVAKASDDTAMADVRVLVDTTEGGVAPLAADGTYRVTVHGALGNHQLTVIARDEAGNETSQMISVTIAKSKIGESCVANDACEGNICATGEDGNFCTQTCDTANDTCPDDFECQAVGGTSVCVVAGGCGCQSNDPRGGAGFVLVLGLGALIARRRRR